MEARFGIHWWRFTTAERDVDSVLDSIVGVSGGDFGSSESMGRFNQPSRYLHTTGTAVYFGSNREGQPIVIETPGEACEQLAVSDLVTWADNCNGSVTRADVAVDVEPSAESRARLLEMRETFRRGDCDTRIPTTSTRWNEDDGEGQGCTLYVGSTQSDCMLRAYDRRGPLRLEWQFKPKHRFIRQAVPDALERYGAAGLWRNLAHQCIWPMTWYQDLLRGKCADIASAPSRPDDLRRTLDAMVEQLGATFGALQLLGIEIGDLAHFPKKPNREQMIRWEQWIVQAPELGYDPSALAYQVKKCRKRK